MINSRTYRLLCTLLMAVWLALPMASGQELRAQSQEPRAERLLSDEARIFLCTCSPGEVLYERYGHTALMVIDSELGISDVYNYGIFDFSAEHFYWRFVKGETYYQLGREDANWFIKSYTYNGRRVVNVQELHLTPEQKDAIYRALIVNYYPENRTYLYNFVFDNCATRPYYLLMNALRADSVQGAVISSTYTGAEGKTYREFIRRYTLRGSWSDLGTNLLFGPKADKPMEGEQRLFLPEELMYYIQEATFADGTPLVDGSYVHPFEIEPIPWYKTWYFGLAVLFAVLAALSLYDRKRGARTKWVDYILYGIYILLLVLVTFLTFFSIHPLVGFGPYLLIIPSIHLCARIIYLWR